MSDVEIERVSIRAYKGQSNMDGDRRMRQHKARLKRLGEKERQSLRESGGLNFSGNKVIHVSKWREDQDGHWGFDKYIGEFPTEESVRAMYNKVEFTS